MAGFVSPFKTLTLYKIKKEFKGQRSNDVFRKDQQLTYLSSTLNHHEGIEICEFKDFNSGEILVWHADDLALAKWSDFFEVIPFPPNLRM